MKKTCLLITVVFCCLLHAYGQKIQYSRQAFKAPYTDAMQLIADIGDHHQIICFNANKNPLIYLFNAQLQLEGKHEIELKLKENSEIRIVRFKEFYFLYVHLPGTSIHELFKIDGQGSITILSKTFQKFIGQEFNKTTSTLQLINQNERLYAMAHTYYDGIKKIGSSIIELDNELNPVLGRKVLYNFNGEEDALQQTMLVDNSLLVLTTSKNDEKGNSLDMTKVDLTTGQSLVHSFNSASHLYTNPSFSYAAKDSSVLVYSMIRQPLNNTRSERTVFMSRLDHLLHETSPVSLLRSQFRNNTIANFLLVQGSSVWVNMNNNLRINRNIGAPASQNFEMGNDPSIVSVSRRWPNISSYFAEYNQPTGIRLTILNENLKAIKDSLIGNEEKVFDVQPNPFAQFSINNKAYLFLIQNFSSSKRGILMVHTNGPGLLTTTDIRVVDKYDYLLQQLQAVNNKYVILPYKYKSDIGLVKISFD